MYSIIFKPIPLWNILNIQSVLTYWSICLEHNVFIDLFLVVDSINDDLFHDTCPFINHRRLCCIYVIFAKTGWPLHALRRFLLCNCLLQNKVSRWLILKKESVCFDEIDFELLAKKNIVYERWDISAIWHDRKSPL